MMRGKWKWVIGGLIVFYIVKSPAEAATQTNGLFGQLSHAGDSLGTFVSKLGQ